MVPEGCLGQLVARTLSTLISLMAVKFSSENAAMTQLSNKVQESNCILYNKNNSINNVGVVWGCGHANWGRDNCRVWFVPEANVCFSDAIWHVANVLDWDLCQG